MYGGVYMGIKPVVYGGIYTTNIPVMNGGVYIAIITVRYGVPYVAIIGLMYGGVYVPIIARDPRRPVFGGTVPVLRAVFRVPPGYMAGHTFVPLFETFGIH
jgi:hypothetical protein